MLQSIIYRLLARRHFWRVADFSELAELYSAMLIRGVAVNMLSPFIALYLLQNGMSVLQVMLFMVLYFIVRLLMTLPSAFIIGRFGPKHAALISNLLYIPAALALSQLPTYHIAALVIFAFLQATAISLFDICYTVNFSKVKKIEHAGKEIGYMYIIQTVAAAASPLVGGFIATLFGAQWVIYAASFLSLIAAIPLFLTAEPVSTHQKISFHGINWRLIRRNMIAQMAVGIDFGASNTIWPIFIVIAIIGVISSEMYAKIGVLTSLTILGALLAGRVYGQIIDRDKGGKLLKFSTLANSVVHLIRGFVGSLMVAGGLNVVNQLFTSGYNMPFYKGMFDTADSLPGYRIVYLTLMEAALSMGLVIIFSITFFFVWLGGDTVGLRLAFLSAGLLTLGILLHGFRALKQKRI